MIQEAILTHLHAYPSGPNVIILYLAWINSRNDWESIYPCLERFFKKNAAYFPAYSFYSKALSVGNLHPQIFKWINVWLKKHFISDEALDLVHTWLMSAKAPMPDSLLLTILKEHILSPKLEDIFQKWLELGFELRVIQIHLIKWLKLFANDRRVDNIYHLLIARNELLPYFEHSYKRWVQIEHKLGV